MKNFTLFLLCFIMIFSLFSCNITDIAPEPFVSSKELLTSESKEAITNTTGQDTQEDTFPDIPSHDELDPEYFSIYEAVLKNELKVHYPTFEGSDYLANCLTPYTNTPLCERENLGYLYIDLDGDSQKELVLNCGDTLVLRYYEGNVYLYPFTFREISYLYTDGSFSWNSNGENFEYGEKRFSFDGTELNTEELWRIINDGEPDAEYYIGGKQVTNEEILKYFESDQKTKVQFSLLDARWLGKISYEEAFEIADEYWNMIDGNVNGACGTSIFNKIIPAESSALSGEYYSFIWQQTEYHHSEEGWEGRPPSRIISREGVRVNICTGRCEPFEISDSIYDSFEDTHTDAAVSCDEAFKIAKEHLKNAYESYKILRSINFNAPKSAYVFKLYLYVEECRYDIRSEIWIDDTTGEVTSPLLPEATFKDAISFDEALAIASEHWDVKNGDIAEETGFPMAITPVHSDNPTVYKLALKWLVENHHYSTIEIIEIDAFTGEVLRTI